MGNLLSQMGLQFNPFEPAASGVPLGGDFWLPVSWKHPLQQLLSSTGQGRGAKALALAGEYGAGKSYVLRWLHQVEFPKRRIKAFYFDNPGVQFYDLANALLRDIGRKDFSKSLWELAATHVTNYQRGLFSDGFDSYLRGYWKPARQAQVLANLQGAILAAKITTDEEIAHRLARIVAETPSKPYFEYRDFVAGKTALVAEREEAPYFAAILKTLRLAAGIEAVAFLVDEFEEISLLKQLSRREAHDYLATLKRLINLTESENLWVVAAMTLDAIDKTAMLEPALWERFTGHGRFQFTIPALTADDAATLISKRLRMARISEFVPPDDIFPFPSDLDKALNPAFFSNPRRLVKICFYAISKAQVVPFTIEYLKEIQDAAYPSGREEEKNVK